MAVTAAHRHPEHVSALVLTVGLARADVRVSAAAAVWQALAAAGADDELAGLVLSTCASDATLRALTAQDAAQARAEITATMPPGAPDHMELVGRVDTTGILAAIDVPTLVIAAGGDRLVPPEISREFVRIPGSLLVEYPDAGHIFTPEEAVTWSGDVDRFLTGQRGR